METIILNQELKIAMPDGFHEMDEAGLRTLHFHSEAPGRVISDPDRHIVLSFAWKKNLLASVMLRSKEVARKMEESLRKPMEPYGYQLQDFLTETLGGIPADGFRYTYRAQEIEMTGETFSVKRGRTFYYLHCYVRTELLGESLAVLRDIFRSCEWI